MSENSPVEVLYGRVRDLLARRDLSAAAPLAADLAAAAPGDARALMLAGAVAAECGDVPGARGRMERAFAIASSQPAPNHLMYANLLLDMGDVPGAEVQARHALAARPAWPPALVTLAQALHRQERLDEAVAACDAALAQDPGYERARVVAAAIGWARARALHRSARVFDAIDEYRRSLAIDGAAADEWNDLGNALVDAGRLPEALAAYREALARDPSYHQVESNLLIALHYDPAIGAERMYEAHRAWAARHASPVAASALPRRAPGAGDRIRIGFISPALRSGPTGAFLSPLLEHLDRARFEVTCYRVAGSEDAVTARLRAAAHAWRDLLDHGDEAIAAAIRADALDVLVDLAGHTPGGRLLVLARRPAPIIATWLDYFDTTGLDAVDYLVGDPVSTPAATAQYFAERLSLIDPCRLCYEPPAYAPDIAAPPILRNGFPTFGSFNRLSKLAPPVVALWAGILRATPGARLILKNGAFADARMRGHIASLFAACGVEAERLELRAHSPHPQMLAEYADVDIALDPFPYNGGLTTCEALWMGLPVLALDGDSMISRQGAALLRSAGHGEWVAHSGEDLIALAQALVADPQALARTRSDARTQLAGTALVDAPRFAKAFAGLVEGWVAR